MATVEVRFSALPAHVRTGCLVAAAVARRSGMPEAGLDDLRLAVGEACARAVDRSRRAAVDQPVTMLLSAEDARFTVTVVDEAACPNSVDGWDGLASAERAITSPSPGEPSADLPRPPGSEVAAPKPAGSDGLWPAGVGLAVIAGLVDDLSVVDRADGPGSQVRMNWRLPPAAGSPPPP